MRTILDEGSTVKRKGWTSIKNGELSKLIESAGQQLKRHPFAPLLLSTNRWPALVKKQVEYDESLWAQRHALCEQRTAARLIKQAAQREYKLGPAEATV